jgi:hypothetical protein
VNAKYLHQCFKLVHKVAVKAAQWNIPMSLKATNMEMLSQSLMTNKSSDGNFVLDCPVASENREEYDNFGDSDRYDNLNRTDFPDAEGLI